MNILSPVLSWLLEHGSRIALVLAIGYAIYYVLHKAIPQMVQRVMAAHMRGKPQEEIRKRTDTLSSVFIKTGVVVIVIGGGFTVLADLGINIAPALAGIGVVGVAVGFGAQSFVKDIIAGLAILMENQYGVGDTVRIAGVTGQVESIDIRKTVLRDADGAVHYVPNGEIVVATNLTKEWARVNMNVSVGYGEDLERAIRVINRVGKEMAADPAWASTVITPPKALWVDTLGDSAVEIKIVGDTKPARQWEVMGELRLRLKKAFDLEGIEIPFPHTKVILHASRPAEANPPGGGTARPPAG